MSRRRSVFWLVIGLLVAGSSSYFITVSIQRIRAGVLFARAMTRLERDGATDEALADAARFARRTDEWRRLVAIAWRLEDDRRWPNVAELALVAAHRLPRDDIWKYTAAFALMRIGRFDEAGEITASADTVSELSQMIETLLVLDPARRDEWRAGLGDLAARGEEEPVLYALGTAFQSQRPIDFFHAGEVTGISEFLVNGALIAAAGGDRERAREGIDRLREVTGGGMLLDDGATLTVLHLATWIDDSEWFFSLVQQLGGQYAVKPAVLSMQADFLLRQHQFARAEEIYRELRNLHPRWSAAAFSNGAALLSHAGRPGAEELYRLGIEYHPRDLHLRLEYASYLIREGRRFDAARTLAAIGGNPRGGRHWLLVRTILGPRRPVERLEADAWDYLNDHPDDAEVAQFLASLFLFRGDDRGLADLRRRYPPEFAGWAGTIHGYQATREGRYAAAEELLENGTTASGLYNYALFLLRHGSLPSAEEAIQRGVRRAEEQNDPFWRARFYLLAAEFARLTGDLDAAIAHADRAVRLRTDMEHIYTYRSILARLQ